MTEESDNKTFETDRTSFPASEPVVCFCEQERSNCKKCRGNADKKEKDSRSLLTTELAGEGESVKTYALSSNSRKAPDGGWGWMVALGSFIVMMLVPMLFPCFGILFSGYLLGNGTSSVTTAWIFNIQGFLWNIMGIFVQPLVDEFGWRGVGFVGISLVSVSLFVSAFAPSPVFLFFSLSLLSGIGGGLVTTMCFLIVPIYFETRRGMANAIMMTGICSGEILGPLLLRFLLDEYGFLGANLIVGSLLLNGFIGILFFHPVEWHSRQAVYKEGDYLQDDLKQLKPNDIPNRDTVVTIKYDDTDDSARGLMLTDHAVYRKRTMSESIESLPLRYELQGSTWTVMSGNLREGYSKNWPTNTEDRPEKGKADETTPAREKSKLVFVAAYRMVKTALRDLAVLKSPRAAIIATGNMLCMNSVMNFVMMMPFAMQDLGHSLQDSAWCLSVSAVCNLLTRMVVSPLSDWQRFSMKLCYMGGYALLGLSMLIFPLLKDLKWLEGVMGIFGCALGANMALYNLVMIEYMGVENLAPVFGASGLMVGIGFLFFGTISGFVVDLSGSYTVSMWMLSAMCVTSFLLWLLMPSAINYDKQKEQRTKAAKFEEAQAD
ncbi:monocarboxylate transporter 9-like [Macrobrachium nipponense]|uniref:monocarboxylate transporter 9-like n=1 Tax=Macrobrachium nipponense TaxID=159736 RepID=UPI0030C8408A